MPLQPAQISAFRSHSVNFIEGLLASDFEWNSFDEDGNGPLHLMCMPKGVHPHSNLAIRLVATKCNHSRNNFGFTPLMLGSLLLPSDLVRVVIEGISHTDRVESSLQDSLLLAATYCRPDVVSELIGAGAKVIDKADHQVPVLRADQLERHKNLLRQIDTFLGVFPDFDREVSKQQGLEGSDLVRLSRSTDGPTRQYVALNPNTPSEILINLAPEFPRAFYKNPSFDWLLVENPDLLFKMKRSVLRHILTLRDCPASILLWAARNGDNSDKLAVVRRIDVSLELLQIVSAGTPCRAAMIAIARNNESQLSQLELALGYDDSTDRLLAAHPNASASLLEKLAKSSDEVVRKNVASHRNTLPATLQEMSDRPIRVHRLK